MGNNNSIDNTVYYKLPCGRFLEDFIYAKRLNFNMGSAVKYRWRQGHKDGEPLEKDMAKGQHYIDFEAKCRGVEWTVVNEEVCNLIKEAMVWDGSDISEKQNTAVCRDILHSMRTLFENHEKNSQPIGFSVVTRLAMLCREADAEPLRRCDEMKTALELWNDFFAYWKEKAGVGPQTAEGYEAIVYMLGERAKTNHA